MMMTWFTHYRRPPRRHVAPPGRDHVRKSPIRTLCGIPLQPWMRNQTVILDPTTGGHAYPRCKTCDRLTG